MAVRLIASLGIHPSKPFALKAALKFPLFNVKNLVQINLVAFALCFGSQEPYAEERLSFKNHHEKWQAFSPSVNLSGDNLERATDATMDLVFRSKISLPKMVDRAAFKVMTEHLVNLSAVDQLDPQGSKLLLYNVLADVFLLLVLEDGKLKEIEFASGASIASSLAIAEEKDALSTLMFQRPHLLGAFKKILLARDLSVLFKKQLFDTSEQKLLATNLVGFMKSIEAAPKDSCAEFARDVFGDQEGSILPDAQLSKDLKESYKLLLVIKGEKSVFVFGDTLINRVRTFLAVEHRQDKCVSGSQITFYIVD